MNDERWWSRGRSRPRTPRSCEAWWSAGDPARALPLATLFNTAIEQHRSRDRPENIRERKKPEREYIEEGGRVGGPGHEPPVDRQKKDHRAGDDLAVHLHRFLPQLRMHY